MIYRLSSFLLSALLSVAVFAGPIDADKAAKLAAQYSANGSAPRLVHKGQRAPQAADNSATPPLYVFSRGENAGFVIVAGDDCVQPILGVTYSGSFDADNMPPALGWIMEGWSNIITRRQAEGTNHTAGPAKAYGTRDVLPLMTAHWDQGEPYNGRAPYMGNSVQHGVTGCVATQGAMLAYFWRNECYKTVQFDTPLYTCNGGKTVIGEDVQIKAGTPYHMELLQDNYSFYYNEYGEWCSAPYSEESGDAVAVLMAVLGMTSQLNYAQGITSGSMANLSKAMSQQLGLDSKFTYRNGETDDEWAGIFLSNLTAGVPIGYGGVDGQGGGHAFICDGYRVHDNLFHFNFGFSGSGDGYFALLAGDADDAGGWGRSQHILYDVAPIHPALEVAMQTTELTSGVENTVAVKLTNNSRLAYRGLCLLLSQDVVDVASAQTTRKLNSVTSVQAGNSGIVEFAFTPQGDRPYNYVITDRYGAVLTEGSLPVVGGTPLEGFQPYVVAALDQLNDAALYSLCLNTAEESRGFLTVSTSAITNCDSKATIKGRFMIIRTERGCYLYSQTYNKFLSPKSKNMNSVPQGFFYILPAETANRWLLVNPLNDMYLQVSSEKIPSYAALTKQDAGNQWLIEAVAAGDEAKAATARQAVADYEATLAEGIPTTGIALSTDIIRLCLDETATLTASVQPAAATSHDITWTSSNEDVATIADGVVTATGVGFAALTATCGNYQARCQVVVTESYSRSLPTGMDEVDERVLYSFSTNGNGFLSMQLPRMVECTRSADENGLFAIIRGNKGYYLWNPAKASFVPVSGEYPGAYPNGTFDIIPSDVEGRWIVKDYNNPEVWMQSWYGYFRNYTEQGGNRPNASNRWLIRPEQLGAAKSIAEAKSRVQAYESGTVHSIEFRNRSVVLVPGETASLILQAFPQTAGTVMANFTSSDESVVTVDGTTLRAVAVGDAVVTATYNGLTAKCDVSVQEPFEPYTLSSTSQLTDGDVYTFDLGNRGYLTYGDPMMEYGTQGTPGDNQRFLILKGTKGYYIYNVAGGKFVPAKDNYVLETPNGAFTFSTANVAGKWIVTSTANNNWMQHGGASQFLINDSWKTQDAGNRWTIAAVDRVAKSQYEAAKQAIADYELSAGNAISQLSAIRENVAYLLFTARGSMLMSADILSGSCVMDEFKRDTEDPCQQWAIIKHEGAYYLYNVGSDTFLGQPAETSEGIAPTPMQIVKQGTAFMFFDDASRVVNIGTAYDNGIDINDWFMPDDGNLFTICKTKATFDSAAVKERLAMAVGVESVLGTVARDNAVYDLQGRRHNRPARGFYIMGGKKVILK